MTVTADTKPLVGRELVLTRTFDAPRSLVWKVWTDPKHAVQWWGPRGCTSPVFEADVRPGGAFRIHMRVPDGTVYPETGVYEEVLEPERLVKFSTVESGGQTLFQARTAVTFEELGTATKVTVEQTFFNLAEEAARARAGAQEGWKQTLDRLSEYLLERA